MLGRCRHVFLSYKKFDDVEVCPFSHPKVSNKMFKFGTNKERGCIGKKIGCNEFHPSQCKDYFDEKCEKDCSKGLHLCIIQKAAKRWPCSKEKREVPPERKSKEALGGFNGCKCNKESTSPKDPVGVTCLVFLYSKFFSMSP